ncbi:MAG TPA: hypothetical protein VM939_11800 [Gemmatimonadaceae bacterium]|nr:hypothetical protein [Gemmatimonadaceae bacterium]
MQLPPEGSEQQSEMLDPHRREDREDAATEISGRLLQKGIEVETDEDSAILADLLTAVDRFESAVTEAGGDPMVNMPTSTDPQNPDFVVPARTADESLEAYTRRINDGAEKLEGRGGA